MSIDKTEKKLTQINDTEIKAMKNRSAYALPNTPANSGMKAPQVKPKFYDFVLGENGVSVISLLKRVIDELNPIIKNYQEGLIELEDAISLLEQKIKDGIILVKKAQCDENGRNIAETYAVEDEINAYFDKILNGDVVVGKAEADAEGNNFIDIYATKSMLDSVKKILEDDLKEGILVPLKAEQDGEGNNIADTYAKNNYVNSTFTAMFKGNIVVGKAQHDKDGNDIGATYATKEQLKDKTSLADVNNQINNQVLNKLASPNGIATLDSNGRIFSSQLPSYVDDVIEGEFINENKFMDWNGNNITPERDKIYVDQENNKSYRWSGFKFVEITGGGVALGFTENTAYRGDLGQKDADDIAEIKETLPTLQPKLTAGNGISISADGTISISLPNGDEVAY